MFEKIWLILSEGYSVDDSGRLSILNIMNKSYAESFPTRFSSIFATLHYRAKKGEYFKDTIVFEVAYFLGDDKVGSLTLDPMEVSMDSHGHMVPIALNELIYPEPGDYIIKVYANDELVAEETVAMRLTSDLEEA